MAGTRQKRNTDLQTEAGKAEARAAVKRQQREAERGRARRALGGQSKLMR